MAPGKMRSRLFYGYLRLRPGFARKWQAQQDLLAVMEAIVTIAEEEQNVIAELQQAEMEGREWRPFGEGE